MLVAPVVTSDVFFAELRQREFARPDASGVPYLDYAGTALSPSARRSASPTTAATSPAP